MAVCMTTPRLAIQPVGNLLKEEFFIPNYQRGYRWESEQVETLLNDLWEFDLKDGYCLQPLVVLRKDDGCWEVIDGQQRLTTIYLILKRLEMLGMSDLYTITYERHVEALEGFLNNENTHKPDAYYLRQAQDSIQCWLHEKDAELFVQKVLEKAYFIWHEIESREEAILTFARLNAGKIRLTDAELIRASLLQRGILDDARRQHIALRWDQIELRLRDPEFHAFLLAGAESSESGIALLFSVLVKMEKGENRDAIGEREVFTILSEMFDKATGQEKLRINRESFWNQVEDLFDILEHWYSDNHLYHLTGFLISQGEQLVSLLNQFKNMNRPCFRQHLKCRMREKVLGQGSVRDLVEEITYQNPAIRKLLLCLNIATLEVDKDQTVRFSFHSYHHGDWDIEHIRATAERLPDKREEWEAALKAMKDYGKRLSGDAHQELKSILNRISDVLTGRQEDQMEALYHEARDAMEGRDDLGANNDIGNLTLLSAGRNRGIGNSPFAVKRAALLDPESQVDYLLPATRNVFTKSYSPAPVNLLQWTPYDADSYREGLMRTLEMFFNENKEG